MDSQIQRYKELWPFHLVDVQGFVGVKCHEETLLPQTIATKLISHLKNTAEAALGFSVDSAVVTVPVHFTNLQKGLTKEACNKAGFQKIQFIVEPVAAAVAYGLQTSIQSNAAKTCLIYNLGGGTFDVTVFQLDANKHIEIKATGGDDRLGGEDFNSIITEFCIDEFKRIYSVNLAEQKTSDDAEVCKQIAKKLRRIRNQCEVQKCYLSLATITSVVISLDNMYKDINLLVKVTRSKFEELILPLLNRSMRILDETLKKSGCAKEEIDDVILIGGSSRIPKVQQMVQEYFVEKQIGRKIDADEAVACGAAVHAWNVFKEDSAQLFVVTSLDETQLRPPSLESTSSLHLRTAASVLETIRWGNKITGFPQRSEHAAVAVGNAIYSFGGVVDHSSLSNSGVNLDVFVLNVNEQEKEWKQLSVTYSKVYIFQRKGHSAVAYNKFVFIFGGYDTMKDKISNSTYGLNTETLKWDKPEVTGNIPDARYFHSAVLCKNKMLIYGGGGRTTELHSLDLETFCWSTIETKGIPPSLRQGHSATVYDDRFILIFGGWDYKEKIRVNTTHSFDVNNKTWTAVETRGTSPSSRSHHCAFVHDGQMYIFGGSNDTYLNDVFCYDPETCEWKEVIPNGEAPSPRDSAGCVSLNHQVFIFGGSNEINVFNDTNVLQM